MTKPAPSESPGTSPSSSANAGVATSRTGTSAASKVAIRRRVTALKLSDSVAQGRGEALRPRVAQQLVEEHRATVAVGYRQPPVGVLVDGPRQVGLTEVADGVAGSSHDVTARGHGEIAVQRGGQLLLGQLGGVD